MGKSLGNHIGVTEAPEEIFGKLMSIPDEVMPQYYDLLLGSEPDPRLPPVQQKRALARAIVARFHSASDAEAAEAHFDRLFKSHDIPEDLEDFDFAANGEDIHLPGLLADAFGMSRSESRRLIEQGGVSLDGQALSALDLPAAELDGRVLKVGKRRFKRLRAS
jgi:tyrosyl-tRNA synthetase